MTHWSPIGALKKVNQICSRRLAAALKNLNFHPSFYLPNKEIDSVVVYKNNIF